LREAVRGNGERSGPSAGAIQTEKHLLDFTPHPAALFEHDLGGVGGIGTGVQATCIAPCDGGFCPAV